MIDGPTLQTLEVGTKVNYSPFGSKDTFPGVVIQNGPTIVGDNAPSTFSTALSMLIVKLDGVSSQLSWITSFFPSGLQELTIVEE